MWENGTLLSTDCPAKSRQTFKNKTKNLLLLQNLELEKENVTMWTFASLKNIFNNPRLFLYLWIFIGTVTKIMVYLHAAFFIMELLTLLIVQQLNAGYKVSLIKEKTV